MITYEEVGDELWWFGYGKFIYAHDERRPSNANMYYRVNKFKKRYSTVTHGFEAVN